MALFSYTISDEDGKLSKDTIAAHDKGAALKMLVEKGNNIVSLQKIGTAKKKWWEWSSGLKQKDILLITKRIGDMTGNGFKIIDAIRTLELQAQNATLKKVATNLRSKIELGTSLSDALEEYPKYFSPAYRSIVKVGEESGTLPKSLKYLEKQEKQIYNLKRKAIGALIYPSIIMGLMVIIGIGMILFFIPFLKEIFSNLNADLPVSTRVLIQSEVILTEYWWLILLGIAATVTALKLLFRNQAVLYTRDSIFLRTPYLGTLIKQYNTAQIIRTFSTLNKTGIPILEALEILETVPKNVKFKDALKQIRLDVKKGAVFSAALSKYPKLFSPLIIESVKLGEQTGNLSDSLSYLADLFEDELKGSLTTITTLIQPLLLVMVGIMVAAFALSVMVPLQQLPRLIQK